MVPQAMQLPALQVEPAQQSVTAVQLLLRGLQQAPAVHGRPLQQSAAVLHVAPPGEQQLFPTQPPEQQSVAAPQCPPLALQQTPWPALAAGLQERPPQQSAAVAQPPPPGAQQTLPVQAPTQQSAGAVQAAWEALQHWPSVQPKPPQQSPEVPQEVPPAPQAQLPLTQLPLQQSVIVLQPVEALPQHVPPPSVLLPRHSSPLQQSLAVPQGPPPPTQPHRPFVPQLPPQQSVAAVQASPPRLQQVPTPRLAPPEQSEPAQQFSRPVRHSVPAQPAEPPPELPPLEVPPPEVLLPEPLPDPLLEPLPEVELGLLLESPVLPELLAVPDFVELVPDELEVAAKLDVDVDPDMDVEVSLEALPLEALEEPLPLDPPIVLDALLELLLPPLPPGPLPVNWQSPLAHSKPLQQSSVVVHDWFALRQTPPVVPFEPVAAEQAARQSATPTVMATRWSMVHVGTTLVAQPSIGALAERSPQVGIGAGGMSRKRKRFSPRRVSSTPRTRGEPCEKPRLCALSKGWSIHGMQDGPAALPGSSSG